MAELQRDAKERHTATSGAARHRKAKPTSQEFLHSLVEGMPAAVLVLKADLEVVFANAAFYTVLGLSNKRVEGRHLTDVLPLDGAEALVRAALKANKPLVEREVIYRHPRRGRRWFRVSVARLREEKGRSSGGKNTLLVLSVDDIMEWRQAQEKIQENSRLISLGEIIAGVAHELNNPLTSVVGFAQLLLEREADTGSKQDLEIIFNEAQRAAKVVRNLLSFARKYEAEKNLVDITSIIDRVLALKAYDLRVSNIELMTHFSPELPKVYADEHQLEQVFLNIVTNAEQAMEEVGRGGRLTVMAQKEPQAVRVSFYDNGPGISASNLKAIFKPFFTTKAPGQGTGLGLSICKSLVREQEGKIWAESEPGKGAAFHVEIPTP